MTRTAWDEIGYRTAVRTAPAMEAFVSAVAKQYANGGCLLSQFEARDHAEFDAATVKHHRLEDCLTGFLGRPEVQAGLKEVQVDRASRFPPPFHAAGAFEFEGALAQLLLAGGAYTGGVGSEEEARRLAREFVDAIVEDRRLLCTVFVLEGAWTPWFFDVMWDHTYILMDRGARCWWTLFMTDTD